MNEMERMETAPELCSSSAVLIRYCSYMNDGFGTFVSHFCLVAYFICWPHDFFVCAQVDHWRSKSISGIPQNSCLGTEAKGPPDLGTDFSLSNFLFFETIFSIFFHAGVNSYATTSRVLDKATLWLHNGDLYNTLSDQKIIILWTSLTSENSAHLYCKQQVS